MCLGSMRRKSGGSREECPDLGCSKRVTFLKVSYFSEPWVENSCCLHAAIRIFAPCTYFQCTLVTCIHLCTCTIIYSSITSGYMEIHVYSSTRTCPFTTVHNSPTTSSVNTSMATPAMMREGTMKLSPQGGLGLLCVGLAQKDGMIVPKIFPREVCAFQIPIISPRLHTKYR